MSVNHSFHYTFMLIGMLFASPWTSVAQEASSDWPQFRGPDANPVSSNSAIPNQWSKTQNIRWAAKIEGRGWSSPIVVGDRVFVTTAVNSGDMKPPQEGTDYSNDYVRELSQQGLSGEEIQKKVMERDFQLAEQVQLKYFLICFNLKDGKELWRKQFFSGRPPGGIHRKNSFASETPVTDGKQVFAYITNLGVYSFDLDGNPGWSHEFESKKVYMEFGTGASPVICDNKLIVVNDNEEDSYIVALQVEDGKVAWQQKRPVGEGYPAGMPKSGWATPYVWRNKLRTEIVTMQPGTAISYDTQGKEIWRLKGCSPAPAASSFAHEGILYLNGGKGKPIYAIKPGASGEIALKASAEAASDESFLLWQSPRAGTYIPTPVIYQGAIYVLQDNGILQRLSLKDGKPTYKVRIKDKNADFTTSPWVVNGNLYCHSEQGTTYVIRTGEKYELLHSNELGEFSMSSPAISNDLLLLRTQEGLFCIGKM